MKRRPQTIDPQRRALAGWALLAGCWPLLAACGGGPGEEGTGSTPGTLSVGVLKGLGDASVTVNGVTYDRSAAQVVDGFGDAIDADELRLGMWLEVEGTLADDRAQGVARTIRVRPAARGVVSAVDGTGLAVTVLDATVRWRNGTVLEGIGTADALAVGDTVEVHGPLGGGAGEVDASRVERLAQLHALAQPYELRGRVSLLDTAARTLTVGRRAVSYAGASVVLRSALADGMVLRVSAASAPVNGTPWAVDRLVADQPLPANLGFLYTEGVVASLQAGPRFLLEGLAVDASNAGNRGVVDAEGLSVAVVGALVEGTLKARSVALIEPGEPVVFTLSGTLSGFVSPADFKLRGVSVDASGASYVAPATPAGLADGRRLRVRGTPLGRRLIATQVEFLP